MLSIREALELMLPSFAPLATERLPLLAADGRVLAQDIAAALDLPEFDNSAMDGYALRLADLADGSVLPVQGESRAGGELPGALAPGTALRIFTGAALPAEADSVVIQEHSELRSDGVSIRERPRLGANIRLRGSDIRQGDALLRAGVALGPGEIGLLAAQGCVQVSVYRRPRVAVLPTGDELRELDAPRRPGSIVNSNSYALAAALRQLGCEPVLLPITPDRLEDIARSVEAGLQADVLLSVGGVSVGDYDLVSRALREAGVAVGFHKVAIKPGKPLLFGQRGAVPVVGLPGNPVSALVTFEVFLRPCLQRMLGHCAIFPDTIEVQLAAPYEHAAGRTEFARARLTHDAGRWLATLHPRQGSASLQSLVGLDALVILPAQSTHFVAGQTLQALRIGTVRRSDLPFAE
jgi:molybdopterin molybdotransferase